MGMINEIVKARDVITSYFARDKKNDFEKKQVWDRRNIYAIKKDTMRNSIFAVDIEPSAVDIAKLRLWLSLVVEQDIDENSDEFNKPLTLPNLDCNIMCGNSLIDEFEGIKLFEGSTLFDKCEKVQKQGSLFTNQDVIDSLLNELFDEQRALFYADNHTAKEERKNKIEKLKNQIILNNLVSIDESKMARIYETSKMPSTPYFLWKLNFAKVFKDKGGFDIVIGNPPYVGESGNKEIFR
ncbi:MAG: type II restriction endonuclease, partial [Clostridia bacterium]|nr:type II restriction endonuclease [Clostridia bacterium]